ncbi:MAG: bacillithiol biosynthesis BshC [Myxococcales bacterium]|nr:bacillithiol biosynthesis BshC [Myxococcales bacterium]
MSLRARPPIAMPEAAAPLTSSLLAGDEPARSLFELRDDATRRAELAAVDHPRAELVALLLEQALARGAGPEARAPIRLLARPDVVVVATGQQIGVLGGPLYTLYKALAAVSHARALTRAGVPAVAVFWMASFDHDLAEVARAALLTGDATPRRVALAVPDTGCPVGHLRPGAAIDALHDEVARALASLPHARVTVNALRRCYRPEVSLADAFARWFGALMDPLGLILLDPADRRFAALTRPLLARALFDALGSAEAAARGRAAMRARGLTRRSGRDRAGASACSSPPKTGAGCRCSATRAASPGPMVIFETRTRAGCWTRRPSASRPTRCCDRSRRTSRCRRSPACSGPASCATTPSSGRCTAGLASPPAAAPAPTPDAPRRSRLHRARARCVAGRRAGARATRRARRPHAGRARRADARRAAARARSRSCTRGSIAVTCAARRRASRRSRVIERGARSSTGR